MQKNKQKGFTLIELMVVVSIIAFLSTIVLGALAQARIKGKDRAFVSEMLEVRKAVELYRANTGSYPGEPQPGSTYSTVSDANGQYISGTSSVNMGDLRTILSPYLSKMPNSPRPSGVFSYRRGPGMRCSNQTTDPAYIITGQLTVPGTIDPSFPTYIGVILSRHVCISAPQ